MSTKELAPTDNGVKEADFWCKKYNDGEIDLNELVCNLWNTALAIGRKESVDLINKMNAEAPSLDSDKPSIDDLVPIADIDYNGYEPDWRMNWREGCDIAMLGKGTTLYACPKGYTDPDKTYA
jgi:hypothetical protein